MLGRWGGRDGVVVLSDEWGTYKISVDFRREMFLMDDLSFDVCDGC